MIYLNLNHLKTNDKNKFKNWETRQKVADVIVLKCELCCEKCRPPANAVLILIQSINQNE